MSKHKEVAAWKSSAIDFTAGSLGGVALVYVGQPMDTVKVKMQTYPHLYSSMVDCCKKVWTHEGVVRGFYAGTIPAILANVAENSVLFACYGLCQKLVSFTTNTKNVEDMGILENASAGCLASFFSSFTLCPTELLKIQLQASHEETLKLGNPSKINLGIYGLTKQIIRNDGVLGLFKGFGPTVAREMPGYFVFFGGYEATRTFLAPANKPKEECGALATMAAGGVGGILLWTVIFPFDVVKSRIQASSQQNSVNMLTQMSDIVKKEGFMTLYSGLQPTLIRTIPASAVLFLVYEYSKKIMNHFLL
ncbi:hypothetical protein WDU94_009660 [Cyamophila willieti]